MLSQCGKGSHALSRYQQDPLGPLILKTDAGPGRLSKDAESWEFREQMHDKGLVILLGLPNGTAAT